MSAPRQSVAERLASIRQRIEAAAARGGRDPAAVTLVAVSKEQPDERIAEAAAAGQRVFGENKVQAALARVEAHPQLEWHFIGTLQRNKARRAIERLGLIHSLDSLRLGETLARLGLERAAPVDALVQVNVGEEDTKSGVAPSELDELIGALSKLEGLRLRGLMTIPPPVDDPEESREAFRWLARSAERLRGGLESFDQLSMGMSDDFEVAVEEGATLVRVGTALFGPRPRKLSK